MVAEHVNTSTRHPLPYNPKQCTTPLSDPSSPQAQAPQHDPCSPRKRPQICIFGFSFKKDTGDARMSQSATIINHLATCSDFLVHVHDPRVSEMAFWVEMEAQGFVGGGGGGGGELVRENVRFYGNDHLAAASSSSALLILTDWDQFNHYDYQAIEQRMRWGCSSEEEEGVSGVEGAGRREVSFYDFRAFIDLTRLKKQANFDKIWRLGKGWV